MSPDLTKKALAHLGKDKIFSKILKQFPEPGYKPSQNYFEALVSSIIYQQITGKAAATIEERFLKLFSARGGSVFGGKFNNFSPQKLLRLTDKQFKSAGISPQKMKYLKDLSEKFLDGTINPKNFHKMTDEEIREHLIAVKGIGRWTADMFLMFTLCRPNVLPTGDLGIQKGFQKVFNLKQLPDTKKMEKLADAWSPYRTFASWYLWRVADLSKKS